jgi:uncharacterized protein YxjI
MGKQSFRLKLKARALRSTYQIEDSSGDPAFRIKGKAFSIRNKFIVEDQEGTPLLRINRRFIGLKPMYKIKRDGDVVAKVKKKRGAWRSKFKVDVPGPDDMLVEGKFWKREYHFERDGRRIAEVSKRFWSWADTYGVEIDDGEDVVLILAVVVCIDLFLKDIESAADVSDEDD